MKTTTDITLQYEFDGTVAISSNTVGVANTLYEVTGDVELSMPEVAELDPGTVIGMKQLSGTGTISQDTSEYGSKGDVSIPSSVEVPAGTTRIAFLAYTYGRKVWYLLSELLTGGGDFGGAGDSNNLGYFTDEAALTTAHATGSAGQFAILGSTDTVWVWDTGGAEWVDTGSGGGSGDMEAATYDPTNVVGDAFDMDNMVEGTNTKILTSAERSKLAGVEAGATADQSNAEILAAVESESGRDMSADGSKLDGIEAGATGNQTANEIKIAYESNDNTNAYTDAEKSKLTGIEDGAEVNPSDSEILSSVETESGRDMSVDGAKLDAIEPGATADQTPAEILSAVESESGRDMSVDGAKLDGIESGATADMSDAEIKTAYENNPNTNAFTDTEKSKLTGIEAGAEVNPSNVEIVTSFETETGRDVSADGSKLDGIEPNATADMSDAEIKTAYENNADTNAYTDSEKSKLAGIESGAEVNPSNSEIVTSFETETGRDVSADGSKLDGIEVGATADQTGAEIKVAYEGEANTNAFTDSEKSKLASIDAAHYGAPLQNTTELSALTEASLTDKERRYVEDETSDYFYDATAVSGDIAPDDQTGGTGFWKKVAVGGETAASIKTKYESNADTNAFTDSEKSKLAGVEANATADQSDAEILAAVESESGRDMSVDGSKLDGIEVGATADMSNGEIKTAYEANANTNAFTDTEKSKLAGIESGATADQSDSEILAAVESESGRDISADGSKLDGIEVGATADMSNGEIKTAYEANADTNAFTDSEKSKLSGIESGATADMSNAEIKSAYEANADTNAFTDALSSKLSGIESGADVTDEANVIAALNGATITSVTVAGGDKVLIQDISDSDNLKYVTAQSIANLYAGGGGGSGGTIQGTDGTYDIKAVTSNDTGTPDSRGEYSVDLCMQRANSSYVPAGANSAMIGGFNNGGTGTGNFWAAGGGNYNTTGTNNILAGANNYNCSAHYSAIFGYNNYGNSGQYNLIAGTENRNNTGSYCGYVGRAHYSNSGSHNFSANYGHYGNSGNYNVFTGYHCHNNSINYSIVSGFANSYNLGLWSFITGAYSSNNNCSQSIIAGIHNNNNSVSSTIICGEWIQSNSSSWSAIFGSYHNNCHGNYLIVGGEDHSVPSEGGYSAVFGMKGYNEWPGTITLSVKKSSDTDNKYGEQQARQTILFQETSNGIETPLESMEGSYLTIRENVTMALDIVVVASRTDAVEYARWTISALVSNSSGITSIIWQNNTKDHDDSAAWTVVLSANDILDTIDILVTGEADKTISWIANIRTTEIGGPVGSGSGGSN